MKKIAIAFAIVIGFGFTEFGTDSAEAASPFRLQIGGGGIHFDIGRSAHHSYGYHGGSHYRTQVYRSPHRGHYDWHDTTHYDYHPGQFYRHGNHYDYQPGHYDLHRSGHYDYHRGSHGYGHHR